MSIKTYLTATVAAGALFAGSAMAAEPMMLSDSDMDNVTAGLNFVDFDLEWDDFEIEDFNQVTLVTFAAQGLATDTTVANALTGNISFGLLAQGQLTFSGGFVSAQGNGEIEIDDFNLDATIDY